MIYYSYNVLHWNVSESVMPKIRIPSAYLINNIKSAYSSTTPSKNKQ